MSTGRRSIPATAVSMEEQLLRETVNELNGSAGDERQRAVRWHELEAAGLLGNGSSNLIQTAQQLERLEARFGAFEGVLTGYTGGYSLLESSISRIDNVLRMQSRQVDSLRTRLTLSSGEGDNARRLLEATADANRALLSRVEFSEDRVEVLAQDTTNLQAAVTLHEGGLSFLGEKVVASASAIQTLEARVTVTEGVIDANSQFITDLQADVTTLEGTTLGHADAIDNLQARVTLTESGVDSVSQRTTTLESTVNDPVTGLGATADALGQLSSRVTTNEGTIDSHSQSITSLESSVALLPTVYLQATMPAGGQYIVGDMWLDSDDGNKVHVWDGMAWGEAVDLIGATIYAQATAPGPGQLRVGDIWFKTSDGNRQHRWNGTQWVDITDTRVAANASAISSLDSRVVVAEGNITTHGQAITELEGSVSDIETSLAGKASASDVTTIFGRLNNADGQNSTIEQMATRTIALEAHVGDDVLGPEIITAAPTLFGVTSTTVADGTKLTATGAGGTARHDVIPAKLTAGQTYEVTVVARRGAQGTTQRVRLVGLSTGDQTVNVTSTAFQTITFRGLALASTTVYLYTYAAGAVGDEIIVQSVSMRQVQNISLADAINTTRVRVDQTEAQTNVNATNIASLTGVVNDPTTGLATKASLTQHNSVKARIDDTGAGRTVEQVASALVAVEGSINDPSTGLATRASASDLTTVTNRINNVDGAGSTVESMAGRTLALEAKVGDWTEPTYEQSQYPANPAVGEVWIDVGAQNGIDWSENLAAATWGNQNVTRTANAYTDADGVVYTNIVPSGVSAAHYVSDSGNNSPAWKYRARVKANGLNYLAVSYTSTASASAVFDLVNGTIVQNGWSGANAAITPLGDGVFLIEYQTNGSVLFLAPKAAVQGTHVQWAGDGVSGVLIGAVQSMDKTFDSRYIKTTGTKIDTRGQDIPYKWDGDSWEPTLAATVADAVQTLDVRSTQNATDIEANSTQLNSLTAAVNDPSTGLATRASNTDMSNAVARLNNTGNGKSIEVVATDVANLTGTINDPNTGLNSKASVTTTTGITNRLNSVGTTGQSVETVAQNAVALKAAVEDATTGLATKASNTRMSTAESRLNDTGGGKSIETVATDLLNLQGAVNDPSTGLAAKASLTQVNQIGADLDTAEGTIAAHTTSINQHASQIAGKAEASVVQTIETRVSAAEAGGAAAGNLLSNATFANDLTTWSLVWNSDGLWGAMTRNLAAPTWKPVGINTIGVNRGGATPTGVYHVIGSALVPVTEGQKFIASVYTATHRAQSQIAIEYLNAAMGVVGTSASAWGVRQGGGENLTAWDRIYVAGTAPTGTRWVRVQLWTQGTGEVDPYSWFARPMLEQVPALQTLPSPWAAGGAEAFGSWSITLDVNNYVSGVSSINNGLVAEFAILADKFRVVKPGGGAGLLWENGVMWNRGSTESIILGQPFGTTGDLLFWAGPNPASVAAASKTNAVFYIDSAGRSAYRGSVIGASNVETASSNTNSNTITATTATFNRDVDSTTREIDVDFSFESNKTTLTNDGTSEVKYGGSLAIEVSIDGGAWTQIGTIGITGINGKYGEPGFTQYTSSAQGKGTLGHTGSGTTYAYRARQATGTMQEIFGATHYRYLSITVTQK